MLLFFKYSWRSWNGNFIIKCFSSIVWCWVFFGEYVLVGMVCVVFIDYCKWLVVFLYRGIYYIKNLIFDEICFNVLWWCDRGIDVMYFVNIFVVLLESKKFKVLILGLNFLCVDNWSYGDDIRFIWNICFLVWFCKIYI